MFVLWGAVRSIAIVSCAFLFFFLTQESVRLREQKALSLLIYLLARSHFPLNHVFLIASQAVSSSPSMLRVLSSLSYYIHLTILSI